MLNASVWFYGDQIDDRGLPRPFHAYLIMASAWSTAPDRAIASVMSLSISAPEPLDRHVLVESGGPEAAFEEALNAITGLPGNQGLKRLVDRRTA